MFFQCVFFVPLIFWAYLVNSQSSKLPCEICLLCQDVDDWFNYNKCHELP